jgi:hypothetical protein
MFRANRPAHVSSLRGDDLAVWCKTYVTVVGTIFCDGTKDSIIGDSGILARMVLGRLRGLVLRVVVAHVVQR